MLTSRKSIDISLLHQGEFPSASLPSLPFPFFRCGCVRSSFLFKANFQLEAVACVAIDHQNQSVLSLALAHSVLSLLLSFTLVTSVSLYLSVYLCFPCTRSEVSSLLLPLASPSIAADCTTKFNAICKMKSIQLIVDFAKHTHAHTHTRVHVCVGVCVWHCVSLIKQWMPSCRKQNAGAGDRCLLRGTKCVCVCSMLLSFGRPSPSLTRSFLPPLQVCGSV